MIAVKLPKPKICHRAVVADVRSFEAIGVNEIGGETVGGAKRRLSEFDGRRREIGVLRKEGVDDLLRDNRRSIVPRRTRVGTPAFVDHNGHLSRTSRTVFDADRAGAVGETGVEDQDALIIDVESVRDLKKVVAELYRARILSGL